MGVTATAPAHVHGGVQTERAGKQRWRLGILAGAMATVAVVEAIGGAVTGSLALLADSAHALTDVLSLVLALYASHLVAKAVRSPRKSFGYYRAEILAAFANAVFLGVLAAFIVVEAVQRALSPSDVEGLQVAMFAGAILVAELVGALVLHRFQGESLNIRSAFVHLIGDILGTIGAVLSGLAIHFYGAGALWLDPAVAIFIAVLLSYWAIRLVRATSHILMEGTPSDIDTASVRGAVEAVQGVRAVHDLHVWTLTSGLHSMSAHVVADHCDPTPDIVERVRERMVAFGLDHVTIQLEDPCHPCEGQHE